MKFSEQELRWLARWEKRERRWVPFTRWFNLGMGLLYIAFGFIFLHELRAIGLPDVGWLIVIPLYFFVKAGLFFVVTFMRWGGDIKLRLLLRLIREHENTDA